MRSSMPRVPVALLTRTPSPAPSTVDGGRHRLLDLQSRGRSRIETALAILLAGSGAAGGESQARRAPAQRRPIRLGLQHRRERVGDGRRPRTAACPSASRTARTPNAHTSARLSARCPRACSGLMYAAVPRIIPACVIAGVVIVGDIDALGDGRRGGLHRLRQPEVEHLHRAVGADLDVRRLQIAVDDALLVRGFERLGDLLRDGQRLVERDRAARDALRRVVALDEFHHERGHAAAFFEAVDGGDVRMIQRGEDFRFALEPREPIGISARTTAAGS